MTLCCKQTPCVMSSSSPQHLQPMYLSMWWERHVFTPGNMLTISSRSGLIKEAKNTSTQRAVCLPRSRCTTTQAVVTLGKRPKVLLRQDPCVGRCQNAAFTLTLASTICSVALSKCLRRHSYKYLCPPPLTLGWPSTKCLYRVVLTPTTVYA